MRVGIRGGEDTGDGGSGGGQVALGSVSSSPTRTNFPTCSANLLPISALVGYCSEPGAAFVFCSAHLV